MADPILTRLRRLAARLEKAKRDRDDGIREARKTHTPTVIAEAVGLSKGRVIQIAQDDGAEDKPLSEAAVKRGKENRGNEVH